MRAQFIKMLLTVIWDSNYPGTLNHSYIATYTRWENKNEKTLLFDIEILHNEASIQLGVIDASNSKLDVCNIPRDNFLNTNLYFICKIKTENSFKKQ